MASLNALKRMSNPSLVAALRSAEISLAKAKLLHPASAKNFEHLLNLYRAEIKRRNITINDPPPESSNE